MPDSSENRKPVVFIRNGLIIADSRRVAERFGKRHSDVIRAIRNLLKELSEDERRNFAFREEIQRHNSGAAKTEFCEMTRMGFTLLAMGFTGKGAIRWKIEYIAAFDAMEAELLRRGSRLPFHLERHLANQANVPDGHFSVLSELAITLVAPLERHGYTLPDHLWPDISQGLMFAKWLRDEHGIDTKAMPQYRCQLLDGRPDVMARAYPERLLGEFRIHFREVWLPKRSVKYFQERDPKALPFLGKAFPLLAPSVAKKLT